MKVFVIILFSAIIAVVTSHDTPKCHNCIDFPVDDDGLAKLALDEWLDDDCVCKESTFQRHSTTVEDVTVYCCDKRRLQRWKGWKRIGHAIEKGVKTILSNTNINVEAKI